MTHWTVVGQILYTLWSDLAQSDPGLGLDCGRRGWGRHTFESDTAAHGGQITRVEGYQVGSTYVANGGRAACANVF